ncbi:GMC family oxidoreductase N-terminal domain-containing protein [Salipiger sp. P9]|uniref:GMC family oxidoreductase n=1 Tax=Salipiger pentaromativorans TaxID=2943193 RepID=UPI00215800AB|nr:GMC family oxidoreductase N-terminal domain-containing protein [Salipiger pentaromativorans]MCR8548391.1 GMC family oxidoreductase N-terminal domain-containing protein [Salipiger pentaromativorans]
MTTTIPDAPFLDGGPYDYIVVGAGSAGCAVAARLAEDRRRSVLLIEAGPRDRSPWVHLPMGYAKLFANPRLNWMYEGEPEPEMNGRRMYQPRGKVLGGSSSINGMMFLRGNHLDFDDWAALGCSGWSFREVLPYFRRSEDHFLGESEWHGSGGPVKISDSTRGGRLPEAVLSACYAADLPRNDDFNGAAQDGFGYYQFNTARGRRWSSARAYLKSAPPNLRILTDCTVERLLFEGRTCRGVALRRTGDDTPLHARAAGEVIVSAGTIAAPQLLMVSGIGPAAGLMAQGIAPVVDRAEVGRNLQDHTSLQVMFRCTEPVTVNDLANSVWRRGLAGLRYGLTRKGVLSETGIYVGGFTRTDPALDRPDLQITLSNWSVAERTSTGARQHPFSGFTISPEHLAPDARGDITLSGPDMRAAPRIRFNFLQTDYDRNALIQGVRLIRRIAAQPVLSVLIAEELRPGPSVQDEAALLSFVREAAGSDIHGVGTCRMGGDEDSVVDPQLRVRGVSGLRVADASIMPRVVRGNTHASTVMIGEKAADLVKGVVQG